MAELDAAPPEVEDEPTNAPEAPDEGQAPEGEESFTDFDISQVPDEYRPQVEALANQWKQTYTKKRQAETQELAQVRQEAEANAQIVNALANPQTRAAVLAQYGVDLVDENDDEDLFDDTDPEQRIERLERTLAERQAADEATRQEEAVIDYISEEIATLEQGEDREFDANEHRLLANYARSNPTPQGYPDVKGAYELLGGIAKARAKAIVDGRTKRVPRGPSSGVPGSRQVDLSKESPEERKKRMAEAVESAGASGE